MEFNLIEAIGYTGSVLVAISLMMRSIVKLRWVNLVGAGIFSLYGLLVGAIPVFLLNGFIVLVNIYYLIQLYATRDSFEILEKDDISDALLRRYIDFYKADIATFFPDFTFSTAKDALVFLILRNMMPVGLFIGEPIGEGKLLVNVDYVIPDYRDLKTARHFFAKQYLFFNKRQIHTLIVKTRVKAHIGYLLKMGFQKHVHNEQIDYLLKL